MHKEMQYTIFENLELKLFLSYVTYLQSMTAVLLL